MKVLSRLEKWSSLYILWPKLPLKLSRMFDLTEVHSIAFLTQKGAELGVG